MAERRFMQDDVVRLATVNLVQAELGLRPVNAISAFAVAGDFRLITVVLRAASVAGVEAEAITVLDHRAVFEVVGRLSHRGCRLRLMQSELRAGQPVDQPAIHEQLTPRANLAHVEFDGVGSQRHMSEDG